MGWVTSINNDTTWASHVDSLSSGGSVTLPARAKAGDVIVAFVVGANTVNNMVFTVSALTNAWTVIDASTNTDNIFRVSGVFVKGNVWVGWTKLTSADITTGSFTVSWTGGTSNVSCTVALARPTSGTSLSSTTNGNLKTVHGSEAATVLCPQNAPGQTHDLRVLCVGTINGPTPTGYTFAELPTRENPGANSKVYQFEAQGGTTDGEGYILITQETSSLDTGAINITESGGTSNPTWYIRAFVISEGAGGNGAPVIGVADYEFSETIVPVVATLMDHDIGLISTDTSKGGGQGISVY